TSPEERVVESAATSTEPVEPSGTSISLRPTASSMASQPARVSGVSRRARRTRRSGEGIGQRGGDGEGGVRAVGGRSGSVGGAAGSIKEASAARDPHQESRPRRLVPTIILGMVPISSYIQTPSVGFHNLVRRFFLSSLVIPVLLAWSIPL